MLVFGERGKPEYPGKPFRSEYRTNKIKAAGIVLWHVITKLKNLSIATEQCTFKVKKKNKCVRFPISTNSDLF